MSKELWGSGFPYRRGNIWWIQYSIRGELYRESSKSKKKSVAVKLLKHRVGESASGRLVIAPVAERVILEAMLKALKADYDRLGNRDTIRAACRYLLAYFGKDTRAVDITRDAITGYIAERRKMLIRRATGNEIVVNRKTIIERILQPPSNGTINLELAALRRAFNVMVEARKLSRDHVPVMPILPKSKPRQGFLDPAEFEQLCARLPEDLRDPVRFLYLSGWRSKKEMPKLEWRDVRFDRDKHSGEIIGGMVTLRAELSKNGEPRVLPLIDDLLQIFARAHSARSLSCPFVFQRDGKPLGSYRQAWRTARKAAGFRTLVQHDFRRSAVSNLVNSGVPDQVAMQITGHKTRSVFDQYFQTDSRKGKNLEAAMTKMSAYVRERAQETPKVVPLGKTA